MAAYDAGDLGVEVGRHAAVGFGPPHVSLRLF
jgi:hypothetical protein